MNELKNVFKFLKNYNEIRNPIITDISEQYWHMDLSKLTENEEVSSVYKEDKYETLKILEVERPKSETEISKDQKQALDFYNELYALYSKINKEAESLELILADGHISWMNDGKKINHPVLLQKVKLEFNTSKPSFTIACEELRTQVNTPLLRSVESINQSVLSEYIQKIENDNIHIANKKENIKIFEKLINTINQDGKYIEDKEAEHKGPTIRCSPTIYLRKRNLGYTEFIDKIIEDLENKGDLKTHKFFENMIGNHSEYKTSKGDQVRRTCKENALLTLPANDEQKKIIEYLDEYGHVLVQGPPGTGKTHTIANLIGHLLSHGERVLVTSHTEKALTVLKDKVYKDLQTLCISLLSSSSERKQMDHTLFEIAEKSTSLDLSISSEKIDQLKEERKLLVRESEMQNEKLVKIRSLEYENIIVADEVFKPSEAAKFIKSGHGKLDYIPEGTSDKTTKLNLSLDELKFLYRSNELISAEEESLLDQVNIDIDCLWTGDVLKKVKQDLLEGKKSLEAWTSQLNFNNNIRKEELEGLLYLSFEMKKELDEMDDFQKFMINKSFKDEMYINFWKKTMKSYTSLINGYETYRTILFENNYDISKSCYNSDTINTLNEIIEKGKEVPVNFLTKISRPKWKKVYDNIKKDGSCLEEKVDYEDVKFIILYELNRNHILKSVNKLLKDTSISVDRTSVESQISTILNKVKTSLRWNDDVWERFKGEFSKRTKDNQSYKEDSFDNISNPILYISKLIRDKYILDTKNTHKLLSIDEQAKGLEGQRSLLSQGKDKSPKIKELLHAFEKQDIESYKACHQNLSDLYNKRKIYLKRKKLIEKLGTIAPAWSKEIESRNAIHGRKYLPKDIDLAWKWRQLNKKLEQINNYDCNKIQDEIELLNKRLLNNAKELSYEKAWFNKVKNNTSIQTQAIEGWKQTMKLIGKGTGKNAPMLREKARELMTLSQTAIPVWIMPLNRVADSFDPTNNEFDTIIIDEASQADILALSVLYLGKKIIIVGDDEQVSPESIGIRIDEVNALREQYLGNIPNGHLFDVRTSIYDMAKSSGFKSLMLTEHFRCLPEIIEFSNQLSYSGRVKSLRDASMVAMNPVVNYRVLNGKRNLGKVNLVEAEHIASLISACVENPAYKDKTIGVITMIGQDQAQEIDKMLQMSLSAEEYKNRRIQCGNSAQFQGDERDIIFISLVDSPKSGGGYIRLLSEDGNNDMNRKRYNVAASRAKDQLWVVHSLNPERDLNPLDVRRKLIQYAMDPKISRSKEELGQFEYPLQAMIKQELLKEGYSLKTNFKVGVYQIDMVIEDGKNRIALECDGEKIYSEKELSRDLKRQNILERLGWKFIRIRASNYYRDPRKTMDCVYDQLEKNDIKAENQDGSLRKTYDLGEELLKEIMINARLKREPELAKELKVPEDFKEYVGEEKTSVLDSIADITKFGLEYGYVKYDHIKEIRMEEDDMEDLFKDLNDMGVSLI